MFDEKVRNIVLKKISKSGYLSIDSDPQEVAVYIE